MKYRVEFITDKRQVKIPEGWKLERTDLVTPPNAKPKYMALFTLEESSPSSPAGFR